MQDQSWDVMGIGQGTNLEEISAHFRSHPVAVGGCHCSPINSFLWLIRLRFFAVAEKKEEKVREGGGARGESGREIGNGALFLPFPSISRALPVPLFTIAPLPRKRWSMARWARQPSHRGGVARGARALLPRSALEELFHKNGEFFGNLFSLYRFFSGFFISLFLFFFSSSSQ